MLDRPFSATLVTSHLGLGGAEKVLATMANYLAGKGWRITFMTLESGGRPHFWRLDTRVRYMDFDWPKAYSIGVPGIRLLCTLARLRKAILSTRPEVVVSFLNTCNIAVLMATYKSGIPVIVSERSEPRYDRIPAKWERLRRIFYPMAACLVTQTRAALDYFPPGIRSLGCIIPNPVVLPEGKVLAGGIDRPPKRIVAVGRLAPVKGFDLLIRAYARIHAENPDWSVIILGEGPERSELERLARELGIEEKVSLPGVVQPIHGRLTEADIFILSSRYEGFPNALCEAMACGLPAISFDCPSGPGAIIRHGIDGLLVPPGDVNALSCAIQLLIRDKALRARLARNATQITDRFSLGKVMGQWERIVKFHLRNNRSYP